MMFDSCLAWELHVIRLEKLLHLRERRDSDGSVLVV